MMTTWLCVCVSDVRQQDWGRRRESTGTTPGEAQQHDNVELGGCVTAIVFEHAHEMLACCQCGNDDHAVVCVSDVRQQHWGGRRESTGPTPGDAQHHDNVEVVQCVSAIVLQHAQGMFFFCWQCGVNDDHVAVCVCE